VPDSTLMSAHQPSLQRRNHAMHSREQTFSLRLAALHLTVADLAGQLPVGVQAIGSDSAAWFDGLGDESVQADPSLMPANTISWAWWRQVNILEGAWHLCAAEKRNACRARFRARWLRFTPALDSSPPRIQNPAFIESMCFSARTGATESYRSPDKLTQNKQREEVGMSRSVGKSTPVLF